MDQLQEKGRVEALIRSLSRFSEKALLILFGKSDVSADAKKIDLVLIFERLWVETGITDAIQNLLNGRKYQETRPIFHQRDETIRGHVFCSFLALVLRKELQRRLEQSGYDFEWLHIKQNLKTLQRVEIPS